MEPGDSSKPTITGRLWLGFGLLVSILIITSFTYFWQIQSINSSVARVLEVQKPLEQAVLEMRVNTSASARAIYSYLRYRDPADVESAREAETGFEAAVVRFNSLAQTDEIRRLGQEMASRFEALKGTANGIMLSADRQYTALLFSRDDIREIDTFISGMLQATINETPPDAVQKLEAALGMRSSLEKIAVATEAYIAGPAPELAEEILDGQSGFRQFSARYGETDLSTYESGWLDHIDQKFEEAVSDGTALIADTDNLYGLLAQFEQSLRETNAYLDDRVQPVVQAGADGASQEVEVAMGFATIALLILCIIGIIVAVVSVLVLSRYITGPLRDLVRGVKVVGSGRLQQRFSTDTRGEFGHLAYSLNQMLETLGRSQEALGESEELAWALLDATNDAVILTDRRGVILASNEIAAGRFGKSLEQMVDESLYDLLSAEAAAPMKAHITEVIRTGKPAHYEDERGGKIIEQTIYPVLSGKGETSRIAIFSRDVTVRKWVEDVTEQLARRNQLILEAAGQGIYGLDTRGKTTFVNPAAARMLGYTPDELIGQHHHELVHHSRPDGKPYPNRECPIYAAFKDGIVRTSVDDEVFWRKDGTSFPVEYTSTPIIDNGRILGAVVTFQDITVRKQVEKALRQNEEKYRSILESAASLIISIDKEGVIVDCNTQIEHMLGYKPEDIIGHRLVDIVHPDERAGVEELLKEVLDKGFEYGNQYRMVLRDGSFIDVSMNAAAVRDASGEHVRIICMIEVISERVNK